MKEKISITVDKALVDWMDSEIGKKFFASRSHAVERALTELKKAIK